jgi:signal transduction histidine kinase
MPFAVFFLNHVFFFAVLLFIILVLLLISCFLLFTNRKMKYFEEIHQTLEQISEGNLDISIPVRSSDELTQLALTVNDMTYKLKVLIEEEKKWEKSKSDFVANVSHDLRTPLTSILGYLELIVQGKYKNEEDLRHYTGIVYHKCQNLKVLVDDLFEYAKLNSTGIKINRIRINLAELLEQVVLGFLPALEEAGMEYRLFFPDHKVFVSADPVLLARMFDNLVSNGVNYGKEGKYLEVELLHEEDTVRVRIINYGNSIPQEVLPLLFERFYKVDKSRSQYSNGSGIGLAIVKSIVKMHQGIVSADSRDNKTVFEVSLPL